MSLVQRALDWLEPRLERVPADLASAVRRCVGQVRTEGESLVSVPEVLAAAAAQEIERVLELPQERDAAVRLLAADASLTWAFEAAAELGEDGPELAERVGIRGRIGRRLAELLEGHRTGDRPGAAAAGEDAGRPPAGAAGEPWGGGRA